MSGSSYGITTSSRLRMSPMVQLKGTEPLAAIIIMSSTMRRIRRRDLNSLKPLQRPFRSIVSDVDDFDHIVRALRVAASYIPTACLQRAVEAVRLVKAGDLCTPAASSRSPREQPASKQAHC